MLVTLECRGKCRRKLCRNETISSKSYTSDVWQSTSVTVTERQRDAATTDSYILYTLRKKYTCKMSNTHRWSLRRVLYCGLCVCSFLAAVTANWHALSVEHSSAWSTPLDGGAGRDANQAICWPWPPDSQTHGRSKVPTKRKYLMLSSRWRPVSQLSGYLYCDNNGVSFRFIVSTMSVGFYLAESTE